MMIRLQITTPDGAVRSLDLRKTEIAVGRNPASPVSFAGDEGKGVSWDHAFIRVEGNQVLVADAGSSNGTLLNDELLPPNQPTALKVKDRIQLGYTGPKIVLAAFDPRLTEQKRPKSPVSAAAPAPAEGAANTEARDRRVLWSFVGGGAAIIVLTVAGVVAFSGKRDREQPDVAQNQNQEPEIEPVILKKDDGRAKVANAGQPPIPPPMSLPHAGRVIKSVNDAPGTLLQWPGEPFSWSPLADNGEVRYKQMLLALPGFRCQVMLESNVRITALSNLPQLNASAPVIETAWWQEAAEQGYDAHLVFDRGRLHFSNSKAKGPARIKLILRNSQWDIVLKDTSSQVVAECWFNPLVASPVGEPGLPKSEPTICFFTDGPVELNRSDKSFALSGRQGLVQVADTLEIRGPGIMPKWPDWWNADYSHSDDEIVLDSVLAVKDWAQALEKSDEVLKTVLKKCKEEKEENRKSMAYLCLGSFGELGAIGEQAIEAICHTLESTDESDDTRRAALFAMQVWLARSSKHIPLLLFTVSVRKQLYSAAEAELILRLTIEVAEADRASPALYQGWLAALESPRPAIRFLAWERLKTAVGEKAKEIPSDYHPNKSPKAPEQAKAIAKWHQLVPPGWVPKQGR